MRSIKLTLVAAVISLSLSLISASTSVADSWISATVNETEMEANVHQKEVFPAHSLISCLSQATPFNWSVMACYSTSRVGEECHLWSVNDVYNGGGILNGTTKHSPCKVRRGFTGKLLIILFPSSRKFGPVAIDVPIEDGVDIIFCILSQKLSP